MANSSDPSCAVRSDGTLKEAYEILPCDKDDELPVAPTSTISMPLCHVLPKVNADSCGDATSLSAHPLNEVSEAEDTNERMDECEALQAMADADHEVCHMVSFTKCSLFNTIYHAGYSREGSE